MRVLRSAGYRQMPWKNGGGTTTEIAVSPRADTAGEFDWRVSMALINADGWFSEFPEVDRVLGILEGKGVYLSIVGSKDVEITPDVAPYGFPADVPTYARLIEGPVIDLNIMTRRDRFTCNVARLKSAIPTTCNLTAHATLFLAYSGPLYIYEESDTAQLEPKDSVIFESRNKAVCVVPNDLAEVYMIEFNTHDR
jgi:uncharacterized protein